MAKKKNIWKNSQNNICFRYEHHSRCWGIPCLVAVVLFTSSIVEYLWLGTCLTIIPFIYFVIFVTYCCTLHNESKEEKIILAMLRKQVTKLVNRDISGRKEVHEVKRKLFNKYKGTYGLVEYRSILVLLSDGTVLEYPLLWSGGEDPYNELVTKVQICTDNERIKFIHPHSIKDIFQGFCISNESKLRIILFGLMFISLSVLIGLGWLLFIFRLTTLFSIVLCIGVFTLLNMIQNFTKNHVFSLIIEILLIPIEVLGLLVKLAHPVMIIIFAFIGVPFFISAGSMMALLGIGQLGITLGVHTMVFISLTLTAILCVHSRKMSLWMIKHSPLKDNGNHRYETFSEQLALYVTEPQNYNFLFSMLYVMFLSLSAFFNIEKGTDLIGKDVDFVILKSFLVFLAFNTMMQRSQETDINTKELLVNVIGLFEHDK